MTLRTILFLIAATLIAAPATAAVIAPATVDAPPVAVVVPVMVKSPLTVMLSFVSTLTPSKFHLLGIIISFKIK